MCLKQHLNNNKLKLMVNHGQTGTEYPSFSLLSTEKEEEEDDLFCETFPNPSFGFPVASCHKLALRLKDDGDAHELALWNPSTKKVTKILPAPQRPPPSVVYIEHVNLYGFGLDPNSTVDIDYKVIRNLKLEFEDPRFWSRRYEHLTELYSTKTNSWKDIACPHKNIVVLSSPIYMNGCNYWPVASGIRCDDFAILSFDFASECFGSALIPGPCAATYKCGSRFADFPCGFLVAEYEGSLAVVVYLVKDSLFELWVWNEENDNQLWFCTRKWAIRNHDSDGVGVLQPLGLYKNDQFYFQDSTGELVLFDCAKQTLKNLGLNKDCCFSSMQIFPCVV